MTAIKQLAGQTLWYGVSNIGAKFLNYLLTPILTYLMIDSSGVRDYGGYSLLYSWIAVANIIFTYGFETGYFRFSNTEGVDRQSLFQTAFGSILLSTALLITFISFFTVPINNFMKLDGHPEYILWCLYLIGLDAITAIPFAKLRQENRPKRYAFVKLSGIIINILFTLFFLIWLPKYALHHPDDAIVHWFINNNRIGFLILANVLQNLFVFLLLFSEWKSFRFKINFSLWKQLFKYCAPMIFIGLAGMINEVMDRQMLAKLLPQEVDAQSVVGIYSANYKLAIFITLFIQAFKMAAEPFFFNKSKDKNAPALYANVMKWFVITLSLAFLFSALYLDVWKYIVGASYRSGLGIVPILLCANICLGIYYNLSVWYKLTDRMRIGLYITLFGSVITLVGNYFFIPYWGMYAAAWTTLICYASMMLVTYFIGQNYYYIPYPVKKIGIYLLAMLLCFFMKRSIDVYSDSWTQDMQLLLRIPVAFILMILYVFFIVKMERKELKNIPLIGKYI
ncbi:polysaccharide biosynthesis C-terminal domain-containing protein [Sphingobacterium anhuiense]|uniref:oligosaccharide flippase family protein n=1 Tax=Sphingobacterium anhuiense TaxID=493780 RepID=UPI003C308CB5